MMTHQARRDDPSGLKEAGETSRVAGTPAVEVTPFSIGTAAIIMATIVAFFGRHLPGSLGGFLLALVLSIAAPFAIGLCIAAVAPTSGAVRGITAVVFYPLAFFSGLYYPMQLMPSVMLDISHFTPLGAAVQAIVYPMFGEFPPTSPLLVLAAYALVFGFLAKRSFRWE